jgi:hypothetical protein
MDDDIVEVMVKVPVTVTVKAPRWLAEDSDEKDLREIVDSVIQRDFPVTIEWKSEPIACVVRIGTTCQRKKWKPCQPNQDRGESSRMAHIAFCLRCSTNNGHQPWCDHPQPCANCKHEMTYGGRTKSKRGGRWCYGLVWHCGRCAHSCWTRVSKREWDQCKDVRLSPRIDV